MRLLNRNIKSGFDLTPKICSSDFYFSYKTTEIIIREVEEEPYLITPTSYTDEVIYNADAKVLRILSSSRSNEGIQITLRPKNDPTLKSYVFKTSDWEEGVSTDWMRTIFWDELTDTEMYEIDLGIESRWLGKATVNTNDSTKINIFGTRSLELPITYNGKMQLFLSNTINMASIDLTLEQSSYGNDTKYSFQKTIYTLPYTIDLYKPEITLKNVSTNNFQLELDKAFDLIGVQYTFSGLSNYWSIYQTPEDDLNFTLPNLPSNFVEQKEILKTVIDTPQHFSCKAYQFYESDFIPNYHSHGIDDQLPCSQFKAYSLRKNF